VKTHILAVDLRGGRKGALAYRKHHRAVWPKVLKSLRKVGVRDMDIYILGQRLVMVMVVGDGFDRKRSFAAHSASDPACAEWETMMRGFQRPPPGAKAGELWTPMTRVFSLSEQLRAQRARRTSSGRPRR